MGGKVVPVAVKDDRVDGMGSMEDEFCFDEESVGEGAKRGRGF